MSKPEPLYLRWRGHDVRIRHDDPLLTRYSQLIVTLSTFRALRERDPKDGILSRDRSS